MRRPSSRWPVPRLALGVALLTPIALAVSPAAGRCPTPSASSSGHVQASIRAAPAGPTNYPIAPVVSRDATNAGRDYPVRPVPFTEVHPSDTFWAPRIETNRVVTIPFAFQQSEETGRVKNFEIAGGLAEGAFCTRYAFDDSDVYKIIEGASYSLAQRPDPKLDQYLDGLIAKIGKAQEPDGYLYTNRTINPKATLPMAGKERWVNEEESHELYNLGHLYEASVAHYLATGKRTLLDVALRSADLLLATFGPDGRKEVPGHQEVEIGLVKLSRITGDRRHLDLAKFFLDQRGNAAGHKLYGEYSQDHRPIVEQTTAVGHAVRAAYMYTGMADVAALTGERTYIDAIDRIWTDVVSAKLYLTGGIGATGAWEGFGPPYELPNGSAYAETCASIANVLWNYRMFLLHGDAKYVDVLERTLYNGLLSGISLQGDRFFYPNPLASFGQHERSPWFACACCPSNIARFIPSVPGYVYAVTADHVYVNLFMAGQGTVKVGDADVRLAQTTRYPWDGAVSLRVGPARPRHFTLMVRIPGWARQAPVPTDLYRYLDPPQIAPVVTVNGRAVSAPLEKGYLPVSREWKDGDTVAVTFPMPIRRVVANDAVKEDIGRVAIERGPLVYCAEWTDHDGRVSNLVLDDAVALAVAPRPALLGGVTVITGKAAGLSVRGGRKVSAARALTLIPYYAWAHRGTGEMAVWLARRPGQARAVPEATLAAKSRVTVSEGGKGAEAIHDLYEPSDSNDHSTQYLHWWPKKGTTEWAQYDFAGPVTVSETAVYWFDDTGQGACRVPASWRLLYRDGDQWKPVQALAPYGVAKDRYNVVAFAPVRTTAVRVEVILPASFSAGIQEWAIR